MDYVVGVSDSVSNNAKKLLNLNKIETVTNSVDTKRFIRNNECQDLALRKKLGFKKKHRKSLFIRVL